MLVVLYLLGPDYCKGRSTEVLVRGVPKAALDVVIFLFSPTSERLEVYLSLTLRALSIRAQCRLDRGTM